MTDVRPKHSPIGASSMYRWARCPGSVRMSQGIESKSSIYAQWGTAAHEVVALALQEAFEKNITVREVLEDMVKHLSIYSDFIEKIKNDEPDTVIHIEHSFDMGALYPDLYGTADCVTYNERLSTLRVIDLKYGQGIVVEAEGNEQASYYALGALTTLPYKVKWVDIIIVQPRAYHPAGPIRTWRVPVTYFIDFQADLIDAAEKTKDPDAYLMAGEHCMFCPAKGFCEERQVKLREDDEKENRAVFKHYSDPKDDFEMLDEPEETKMDLNDALSKLFS